MDKTVSRLFVIIVDDDMLKALEIGRALSGINNNIGIEIVKNQELFWEEIEKSRFGGRKIDLIVTDMQYPLRAGGEVEKEAGFMLIERLKAEKENIPVIVCSSAQYSIPDILGCVWYSERNDLKADFRGILKKMENFC